MYASRSDLYLPPLLPAQANSLEYGLASMVRLSPDLRKSNRLRGMDSAPAPALMPSFDRLTLAAAAEKYFSNGEKRGLDAKANQESGLNAKGYAGRTGPRSFWRRGAATHRRCIGRESDGGNFSALHPYRLGDRRPKPPTGGLSVGLDGPPKGNPRAPERLSF